MAPFAFSAPVKFTMPAAVFGFTIATYNLVRLPKRLAEAAA